MPTWDFICPCCQQTTQYWYVNAKARDIDPPRCRRDNSMMSPIVSAPAFKIEGYNAANGYSKRETPKA